MTKQGKQTTAYVLGGLGLVAGTIGIFYASKKGYGGWGKFGMFLLFASPFSISSGALQMSAANDKQNTKSSVTYIEICDDGTRTTELGGCNEHGGAIGYEEL